jgi:hypothetical protein
VSIINLIPEGWWLARLHEDRTEQRFAGTTHQPLGTYTAGLQSEWGGRLTEAKGASPEEAVQRAADEVRHRLDLTRRGEPGGWVSLPGQEPWNRPAAPLVLPSYPQR